MGRGNISVEKAIINDKPFYLFFFRNPLGKALYNGKFDGTYSLKRVIPEKASKNQLKVRFLTPRPDPETKKYIAEDCVISFSKEKVLQAFQEQFDLAIKTLKNA